MFKVFSLRRSFQMLQDELNGVQPQINYIKDFVDTLVSDATGIGDTSHVTAALDGVVEHYEWLWDNMSEKLTKMEAASEMITNFQVRTNPQSLNATWQF